MDVLWLSCLQLRKSALVFNPCKRCKRLQACATTGVLRQPQQLPLPTALQGGGPHSKKHCTSQSVCLIDFSSSKSQTSVANLIENPQVKFRRAGLSCAWARPEQTWIAAAEVEHSLVSQPCRGFRKGGWDCVLEACPKEYYRPANSRTSVLCQGPSSENGSLHGRHAWDIQMPSASIK